jgi:glycerophosphoryl diester phosphodiesterase
MTTDVATRGEFAARRTTKVIDDAIISGWFTEDFTLAELRVLRTKERMWLNVEIKHSTYLRSVVLPLEEELLTVLYENGTGSHRDPVWIAGSEVANLRYLAERRAVNLVQVIRGTGGPHDLQLPRGHRTYADLTSRKGLREISRYAQAVALSTRALSHRTSKGACWNQLR